MNVISNTSQELLPTAVGMTYVAFLTSIPPEVVLGAFAGSVVFLLGVADKPKWQWLLYFTIAFIAGLLGAKAIADITGGLLAIVSIHASLPIGLGALLSAACTINLVSWLRDNPTFFFRKPTKEPGA